MTFAKTLALTAAAVLFAAPAFAQSAGTLLTGTSDGKQGTPASETSIGTPAAQGQTGATSAAKPRDTLGN